MRRPAMFAGRFYPAGADECKRMLARMFAGLEAGDAIAANGAVAAIVPHAGWVFSGRTAARGIAALAGAAPATIITFGAVHGANPHRGTLYAAGTWETPIGDIEVDAELAEAIASHEHVVVEPGAHVQEHSLEVQMPLIRHALPEARIVPILVRPGPWAEGIGRASAEAARRLGRRVAFIGSTDLTHYGPTFGFEPAGRGEAGIRWAKEVNDRRLIERIAGLDADEVQAEAAVHHNACGPGAVAATIGAARAVGALRYMELEHTTSAEAEVLRGERTDTSVGYEAGVFVVG